MRCVFSFGVDSGWLREHNERMKRTNLVLNEQLLHEAKRISGENTYSATVNRALDEFVRRAKARLILDLRGSGLWDGDLAEMRSDNPSG